MRLIVTFLLLSISLGSAQGASERIKSLVEGPIESQKAVGRERGGGISCFRSERFFLPDTDHTVIVLANCGQTSAGGLAQDIARMIFDEDTRDKD